MMIDLPYVQDRKTHYRYRRKVPAPLQSVIGKREIVIPLGSTEAEVVKRWPKANKDAEKLLADALVALTTPARAMPPVELTPFERYMRANQNILNLGFSREWRGGDPYEDDETVHREALAEHIASKCPQDAEGNPKGLSEADRALVMALTLGAAGKAPEATLEDARKFYIKEKIVGTDDENRKTLRFDRVVGHVRKALGRDPILAELTRSDAREVRDDMLSHPKMKAVTVARYMNDINAMINHAIEEFPLPHVTNPFKKLDVKIEGSRRDDRLPFSPEQLKSVRARVLESASTDLQLIWRMLEGTGCRLSEVAGLMVSDVCLDHHYPHLRLVFHPHRRLKNKGSMRWVPLVGDALTAAREAVSSAGEAPLVFNRYGATTTARNVASAALMKHVRAKVSSEKITVHSLRHTLKDRLRLAGVEGGIIDEILGHSSGRVSQNYGGEEARIEVATRAMKKMMDDPEVR